ncbi:apoptosis-associated speck-like protein containing a CARD [Latimeria chalumnae]|uniref:apoptosis-associated speck-like protein containing a CARD n=1 Tax=Latimeria chalumnae TaxID=7897 RepID=UPI00313EDA48
MAQKIRERTKTKGQTYRTKNKDSQCDLININMDNTIKDILYNILSELTGSEPKTFKWKLQDIKVKDGYKNIPKGKLEKADECDLTDLLISYYPDGYAAKVMKNVLDAINKKDLADKLHEVVQRGVNTSSTANQQQMTGKFQKYLVIITYTISELQWCAFLQDQKLEKTQ